jgi:hypothetical protein
MKVYRWSTGIAPLILNLGTRWRWVFNLSPRPFYPEKESRYPSNRRLGGPQSRSGRFGEENDLLPLLGFKPQIAQPVA